MDYKKQATRKIKAKLARTGLEALLVSGPFNVRYLTGWHSSGILLLVRKKGQPILIVDSMNKTLAEDKLKGLDLDITTASRSILQRLAEYLRSEKIKKVGFSGEDLSVSNFNRLTRLAPGVRFIEKAKSLEVSSILKDLRKIKNPREIKILKKAARETVSIWKSIKRNIVAGLSEKKIASMVDGLVRSKGYENSFPTIVAIGENTARPHAIPTDRCLRDGEHVLVDFGIRYKGYCSDLTRVYYNGRISGQIEDFRRIVQKVCKFAIGGIKPGIKVSTLVSKSETFFDDGDAGEYVLHGLGHGLGLEIHEMPSLNKKSPGRFAEGMVITIEPGLYKEGLGGIREENMVLVTKKGCEVLTK
ncbi:MAG: aminopeptidase P family protein [Candidatus Omnitrophica bacterium]|nr:aminopeptidase P family protein [Candidatus Omnitrophota bacterium]